MAAVGAMHHILQPAQVVLHGADFGQAVEGPHDKKRIPQPAVTVVPVAAAVGSLGNAGGYSGHDGAGLFVLAQLERDRGTDHGILPLDRHGQAARPVAPVQQGLFLEVAGCLLDGIAQGFVRSEQQADRRMQREHGALGNVGGRRVGGQAQRHVRQHIAQVIAAARLQRCTGAPVTTGFDRDAHPRMPGQGADASHQLRRVEDAVMVEEARREVGHLDGGPRGCEQAGSQHGGAGFVGLCAVGTALQQDRHAAFLGQGRLRVEQRMEYRRAVEPRHAAPDHRSPAIDQRGH